MRQRVCIARTLVMQPRLILLDEPFGALDQQTRLLMGDEVLNLWRKTGATVFLITHALDEAAMLADRIGVMSARAGPHHRHRGNRLAEGARQPHRAGRSLRRHHRPPVAFAARGIDARHRLPGRGGMKPTAICRIAFLGALVALLEVLCLLGRIDKLTMQPPHQIVLDLVRMLAAGTLNLAILKTLANALLAFGLAMLAGVTAALLLHRLRGMREALDPLFATYYAVPVFAFYPLLIILFGLGDTPEIFIGFMLAVVAVIVSVLSGLDRIPRVLLKTARVHQLSTWDTARRVTLPCIAPYILTGAKLALAYALIGVIGAEFIMSSNGMGYEISFAYTNFDNATMYPLILLIVLASVSINTVLGRWERLLMLRRGLL